jgi:hypothetical protein
MNGRSLGSDAPHRHQFFLAPPRSGLFWTFSEEDGQVYRDQSMPAEPQDDVCELARWA